MSAYVGVGQVAAGDIETVVYGRVIEIAQQRGDDSTLRELRALAPYPSDVGREFTVPIIFLEGRYDLDTRDESARQYYDAIQSPRTRVGTVNRNDHPIRADLTSAVHLPQPRRVGWVAPA